MKISWKFYLVSAIIFFLSIAVSGYLSTTETSKEISKVPAIGALVLALFQLFKDQVAFERSLILQNKQNQFQLGATSHMANVAFDNHVKFCEEYIANVHRIIPMLFSEGPSPEALIYAGELNAIQRKYTAWLTPQITEDLFKFEQALRDIGSNSYFVRDTIGTGHPERDPAIKIMYQKFKEVLSIGSFQSSEFENTAAVSTIVNKIRNILGIEQLTKLRQELIKNALETL